MQQIEQDSNEEKRELTAVDFVVLSFTTIVGIVFPSIAVLVLFACILEMILKAVHRSTPPIKNDHSIYRKFIRPIVRFILWGPVAAVATILLVVLAVAIRVYALPVILVVVLWVCISGVKLLLRKDTSPRDSAETLTLTDNNAEKSGD